MRDDSMGQALAFTKDKNQIATPWHIVEFFSDLLHVQDKAVLDPTAGNGAMLAFAGKRLGIELDDKPYRMLCERYPDGSFLNASVFDCGAWIAERKPDVVLMNPPFNADKTKGLEFVRFTADALDTGTLVAIIPTGAISSGNKIVTATKKAILGHSTLQAVLKLNSDLFYPSAAAAVVALVLKIGTPHSGTTWFADFENDGLVKVRGRGRLDEAGTWSETKQRWMALYMEKPEHIVVKDPPDDYIPCVLVTVTASDDWNPAQTIPRDPQNLIPTDEDFQKTVREYMDWQIGQIGLQAFLDKNPHLKPSKEEQLRRLYKQRAEIQASIDMLEMELHGRSV